MGGDFAALSASRPTHRPTRRPPLPTLATFLFVLLAAGCLAGGCRPVAGGGGGRSPAAPVADAGQTRPSLLTEAERATQASGGTWMALFPADRPGARWPLATWALLAAALGLVGVPYALALLPGLPDRGYGLARTLGFLLLAWASWFPVAAGWAASSRREVALVLVGLGLGAAALAFVNGRAWLGWLGANWRVVAAAEAAFWLGAAALLLVRAGNPDLWHPVHGGEKPMDLAYLTATVKSTSFPPYDPWFAGGVLNYYYFGQVAVGALVKLTGTPPSTAYNLALPLLYGLTVAGAFSAGFNLYALLVRPRRNVTTEALGAGGLAALGVAALGNLAGGLDLAARLWHALTGGAPLQLPIDWYWGPTRVIVDTVNGQRVDTIDEFPFFSFLYGDLHAHVIALPLTLLVLGWALSRLMPPVEARALPPIATRPALAETGLSPLHLSGHPHAARPLNGRLAAHAWLLRRFAGAPPLDAAPPLFAEPTAAAALRLGPEAETVLARPGLPTHDEAALSLGSDAGPGAAGAPAATSEPGVVPMPRGPARVTALAAAAVAYRRSRRTIPAAVPWPAPGPLGETPGLGASVAAGSREGEAVGPETWLREVGALLIGALALGALGAANSWDLPTYAAIAIGATLLGAALPLGWWRGGATSRAAVRWRLARLAGALLLLPLALALYAPFWGRFERFYSGVTSIPYRSGLGDYLAIHGLFLYVLAGALALVGGRLVAGSRFARLGRLVLRHLRRLPRLLHRLQSTAAEPTSPTAHAGRATSPPATLVGLLITWAVAGAVGLAGAPVAGLLGAGLALVGGLLLGGLRRRGAAAMAAPWVFVLGLAALGFALGLFCEFFAIDGDIGRMNTVFKFYYQVWTLWACLAAVLAVWLLRELPDGWRDLWLAGGAVLLLLAFVYVPVATRGRLLERFEPLPPTLDGEAYLRVARHDFQGTRLDLADDLAAIEWLRTHVDGSPVILEGTAPLYDWGARYAIYTGLPTVIGWDWHQAQQRWGYRDAVDLRLDDVWQIYTHPAPEERLARLHAHGVRYIVVGGLERATYPAASLAVFDAMAAPGGPLRVAYDRGGVRIYEVLA